MERGKEDWSTEYTEGHGKGRGMVLDFGLSLENYNHVLQAHGCYQSRRATLPLSVSFRVFRGPIFSVSFPFRVFRVFRGHSRRGAVKLSRFAIAVRIARFAFKCS